MIVTSMQIYAQINKTEGEEKATPWQPSSRKHLPCHGRKHNQRTQSGICSFPVYYLQIIF